MKGFITFFAAALFLSVTTPTWGGTKLYLGSSSNSCSSSKIVVLGAYGIVTIAKGQTKEIKLTSNTFNWGCTSIQQNWIKKGPYGTNTVKVKRSSSGKITWYFYSEMSYWSSRGVKVKKCYGSNSTYKLDTREGRKTITSGKYYRFSVPSYHRKYQYCGSSRSLWPSLPYGTNWVMVYKSGSSVIFYCYKGTPKKFKYSGPTIVIGGLNFNNR